MMKKMLTDRRGVAIEMAVLMTVICFAVSSIVLSTALLQYEKKVRAEERLEESVVLEQITEKFLSSVPVETIQKWVNEKYPKSGYIVKISGDQLTVEKADETVLTAEKNGTTITKWQKG